MDMFTKILEKTQDEKVELADSFKEVLHKELCLGMTRYVCRYGSLGDGHEKITDSQKYYQAIKEMWARRESIIEHRSLAMECQANLLEATELLKTKLSPANKLRAEAKKLRAESQLLTSLVTVEDLLRQMDEFNKVRLELKDKVTAQYPLGIEQAEGDNWLAVAEYRLAKEKQPGFAKERLDNIPLPPAEKAKLGVRSGRIDALAPIMVTQKELLLNSKNETDFIRKVEYKQKETNS